MLATVFNLPKWLLAAVVFCVVIGYCQQAECKLTGCPSDLVDATAKAPTKDDPTPKGATDDCPCQCHFSVSTSFEIPPAFALLRLAEVVKLIERIDRAPEAPCAEIEYPPRSFRA